MKPPANVEKYRAVCSGHRRAGYHNREENETPAPKLKRAVSAEVPEIRRMPSHRVGKELRFYWSEIRQWQREVQQRKAA